MNEQPGVTCAACGTQSAPGQRFCTTCGATLPEPVSTAAAACPACGAALAPEQRFCTTCGAATPPGPEPVVTAPPAAVPPVGADACRTCGTVLTPGLRFCTSCGAPATPASQSSEATLSLPMGPPAGGDQSPWPLYAPAPRPGRGKWAVLVLVALLLLTGVVIGAVLVLGGDDTDRAGDDEGRDSSPSAEQDPSSDGDPTPSGSPSDPVPSPETSSSAPVARFRCWDGAEVVSLSECTQPAGRPGLEYVYPSMAGQDCRSIDSSDVIGQVLLVQCVDYLEDGSPVTIDYALWETVAAAVAHYDEEGLTRAETSEVYGWSGLTRDGYNAVGLYKSDPLSTSYYADSPEGLAEAMNGLVQGQPPGEVRGEPIS